EVFNLLLQLLDDGRLTDGHGRTVDFRNAVVIMTSNIGSTHIQDILEEKARRPAAHWLDENRQNLRDKIMSDLKAFFRPEFLNRVDDIIIFNPLNEELLKSIVEIQIARMKKYLLDKKIDMVLTDTAKQHIAHAGYDPVFGARPLKRAIQNEILNPLALKILDRTFKEGDVVEADYDGKNIVFTALATGEVIY